MTISKEYLNNELEIALKEKSDAEDGKNETQRNIALGKVVALRAVLVELTKLPVKKEKKPIDIDKVYKKIVKKYVDDGMTVVEANEIAQKVIKKQQTIEES